jgi:hypothetical protein
VLNCTWDDVEAELVLRNLELPVDERQKMHNFYLKLREEYRRKSTQKPAPNGAEAKD